MDVTFINRKSIRALVVYRLPETGAAIGLFLEEFSSLLEEVVVCSEELLIIGDFNFHMDDSADIYPAQFGSLLELFNLKQHVAVPTHRGGHILDLVLSRKGAVVFKVNELVVMEQLISNHKANCSQLNLQKPLNERKSVVRCRLRNFDFEAFKKMIISSGLLADVSDLPMELLVDRYENVLRNTMDILAPVKSRTIVLHPNAPWYNENIGNEKRKRRRLEPGRWRSSRLESDKACKLDPLPATIMRSCYLALVPVFKTVINLSLSTGSIPEDLKIASLRPLPNKLNADCEQFSNFRPVFNLKFLSKLVEKSVFAQLNNYLTVNGLHERFQSAHKAHHSTETALLTITNDILLSLDRRDNVLLLLLDLSAAFDTVKHSLLLSRLKNSFGRSLGVVLDHNMLFDVHVSDICRSSFYQLRNLSKIRK